MTVSYVDLACERAGVTPAEWDALVQSSGNVFATRLWLDTWYRQLGFGREVTAVAARADDGRLVGLLPLIVERRHPRVLLPAGLWPPPAGPIVSTSADLGDAAHRLAGELKRSGHWDVLMAAALPVEAGWRDELRAFPRGREHNRVIAFGGMNAEQWFASRSRNFRKQTRKRDERLAAAFDVRYRRTEDPARLDADLDVLFGLHDKRYGEGSTGLSRDREGFHREISASALERGWLALWFIELDGRAVAGNLHFRYEGIEHSYQTGRDEQFEEVNAGVALVTQTVRAAADEGIDEFHFLHGDQEFKRRLATDDRPVETLAVSSGLMGDAALGGLALMSRAESLLVSVVSML